MGFSLFSSVPSRKYPLLVESGSGDKKRAAETWNMTVEPILRQALANMNDVVTPFLLAVYNCKDINAFIEKIKSPDRNKADFGTENISTNADKAVRYILWLIINMKQKELFYILDLFDNPHKKTIGMEFLKDLKAPLVQATDHSVERLLAQYLAYFLEDEKVSEVIAKRESQFRELDAKYAEIEGEITGDKKAVIQMRIEAKNQALMKIAELEVIKRRYKKACDEEEFTGSFDDFLVTFGKWIKPLSKEDENRIKYVAEATEVRDYLFQLYKARDVIKVFESSADKKFLQEKRDENGLLKDDPSIKALFLAAKPELKKLYADYDKIRDRAVGLLAILQEEREDERKRERREGADYEKSKFSTLYDELFNFLDSPLNTNSLRNGIVATLNDRIPRLINIVSQLEDEVSNVAKRKAREDRKNLQESGKGKEKKGEKGSVVPLALIEDEARARKSALSTLSIIAPFKKELASTTLVGVQARARVRLFELKHETGPTTFIKNEINNEEDIDEAGELDDADKLEALLKEFEQLDPKSLDYEEKLKGLRDKFRNLERSVDVNKFSKDYLPHFILRIVGRVQDNIKVLLKIRHIKEEVQGLHENLMQIKKEGTKASSRPSSNAPSREGTEKKKEKDVDGDDKDKDKGSSSTLRIKTK